MKATGKKIRITISAKLKVHVHVASVAYFQCHNEIEYILLHELQTELETIAHR